MFLSLTNWQVVGDWQFVGLANSQNIASGQDNLFNESLRVTFITASAGFRSSRLSR